MGKDDRCWSVIIISTLAGGQLSKSCWQAAGTGVVPMPLILGILRHIYGARSQRIQYSRSSMKLPSNLLNQLPPKFMNGAGHRPPGLACRGVALHSPRVHPFQCSSSNLWPHSRYRCPTFQRQAHGYMLLDEMIFRI